MFVFYKNYDFLLNLWLYYNYVNVRLSLSGRPIFQELKFGIRSARVSDEELFLEAESEGKVPLEVEWKIADD